MNESYFRPTDAKFAKEGLTFDDVLLLPAESEFPPSEADTKTYLTSNIQLNIPISSSAMDTVTESAMAVALARQGGIGIIHKNISIDRQVREVDSVKRSANGVIIDPVSLRPDATVGDAKAEYENRAGVPSHTHTLIVPIMMHAPHGMCC